MKPRLFFRLLQPARTLPFVLLFSGFSLLMGHVFFKLAWPRDTLFVTAAVTLPLLAGAALTGLFHAVLHRPSTLLLPDLLPKLRRAAAFAYLTLALVVTLVCALIEPAASAFAVFGLALGLLTLSCANRRLGFPQFKFLGLMPGSLAIFSAWLVFHLRFVHEFLPALQAAPWAFFVVGIAISVTTLSLGFSRRTLRQRATTPYFVSAYTWSALVDQSALRRQLQEQTQFNASRGLGRQRTGRDWPFRAVGPRLRDWLRVLDHQQAVSMPKMRALSAAAMAFSLGVAFAMLGAFEFRHGPYLTGLMTALAQLTGDADQMDSLARTGVIVVAISLCGASLGMGASRPTLAYPLSRRRLADLVFLQLCRHLTVNLAVQLLAFWFCSLVGQTATQHFNPLLGLPVLLLYWLTLAPFLVLTTLAAFTARKSHAFALQWVVCVGAAVVLQFARLDRHVFVLSPTGLTLSLLATAGALALLRRRIRRHYAACDLTAETAFITPFGASAAQR